jgi:DNA mismatch endonuclease (patch repair protein)
MDSLRIQLRSENMSRIRGRDTSPELKLRSALWRQGLRYRVNARIDGVRPDILFVTRRLAIFVDGCFWHGCPAHYVRPRSASEFWSNKLVTNVERDRAQTLRLLHSGWDILRYWEHEINNNLQYVTSEIIAVYEGEKSHDILKNRVVVSKVAPLDSNELQETWCIQNLLDKHKEVLEIRARRSKGKPY